MIGEAVRGHIDDEEDSDALPVGISFAFLDVSIWRAALLIGVRTCLLSFVGVLVGRRIGAAFGAPPSSPGASSSS